MWIHKNSISILLLKRKNEAKSDFNTSVQIIDFVKVCSQSGGFLTVI